MAAYLNGVRCWHFLQQRPPDPADFMSTHRPSSAMPAPLQPPAQRPLAASRPKTAGSTRLASFPSISSSAEGHRELLKRRRQALLAESHRVQALLAKPEAAAAGEPDAGLPGSAKSAQSQPRSLRPGTGSAKRPSSAAPNLGTSASAPSRQRLPTWQLPSANDLPTFKSPGVWKAMTYMEFDGKGLVPNHKLW